MPYTTAPRLLAVHSPHDALLTFHRIRVGECLFIPCLDLQQVELEGRQMAIALGIGMKATRCIYNAHLGVMFRRTS